MADRTLGAQLEQEREILVEALRRCRPRDPRYVTAEDKEQVFAGLCTVGEDGHCRFTRPAEHTARCWYKLDAEYATGISCPVGCSPAVALRCRNSSGSRGMIEVPTRVGMSPVSDGR